MGDAVLLDFDFEDGLVVLCQVGLHRVQLRSDTSLREQIVHLNLLMELKCKSVMHLVLRPINQHRQAGLATDDIALCPHFRVEPNDYVLRQLLD